MLKNISGQYAYFSLVSAISGNPVTGASGSISGRKSLDGLSGLILLSGNIIELGGGSYRANLYDFDTNGNQVGYFFSSSGCVPVQYQFDMTDGLASGHVWLAVGQNANLSGINAIVPPGNLSGVGTISTIYSGTLSKFSLSSGVLAVEIPQAVHVWNYSGTDASGIRCLLNAGRKLVNKWDTSAASGRLSVYKEDDSTLAIRQDITSQSGAAPIVALDTN